MWFDYIPPIGKTARAVPYAITAKCDTCPVVAPYVIPAKKDHSWQRCPGCYAWVLVVRAHF